MKPHRRKRNRGNSQLWSAEWLYGYLKNNPDISEEERALCNDILK
jgi:hypothetical protein